MFGILLVFGGPHGCVELNIVDLPFTFRPPAGTTYLGKENPMLFEVTRTPRVALAITGILLGSVLGVAYGQPAQGGPDGRAKWQAKMSSRWEGLTDGVRSTNDANNALDGEKTGKFAFHTNQDNPAWWMVDFGSEIYVDYIKVYNRMDHESDRAIPFTVWLAPEGNEPANRYDWEKLAINKYGSGFKTWNAPFGGVNPDKTTESKGQPPAKVLIGRNVRYLKIQLTKKEYLHLDQVEVTWSAAKKSEGVKADPLTADGLDLNGKPTTDPLLKPFNR